MKKITEILLLLKNFFVEFPFKKYWVIGISVFLFLFSTLLSFYRNFPPEPIIRGANDALSPFGIEISSEEVRIYFPFKLKLISPAIYYKNKKFISPKEIIIRIYPLKYLFGKKSARAKISTEEGFAELKFTLSKKFFDFKTRGKNFKYEGEVEMPFYQFSFSLFLNGEIKGRINTEDISASDITGNLEIKDFVLKKLSFGIAEINDIKIGDIASKLSMKNGTLSLADVSFKSSDLEGTVNLEVVLSRKLTLSRLRGNLSVKLGFRLRQMLEGMNLPVQTFLKDGNRIDLKIGGTAGNPSFSLM